MLDANIYTVVDLHGPLVKHNIGTGPQRDQPLALPTKLRRGFYRMTFRNNMLQCGSKPFICPEKDTDKAWFALKHARNEFTTR